VSFAAPNTGQLVQGFSESREQSSNGRRYYEGVLGVACQQLHIVNPATGRLLTEEEEE
jgi:hypothetical protein